MTRVKIVLRFPFHSKYIFAIKRFALVSVIPRLQVSVPPLLIPALKRPTRTFGIFARNAIMLIRLVVFKFNGHDQTNVFRLSKCYS